MTFDPRDPRTYALATDEQLMGHAVGERGNMSGRSIVEANRRLRVALEAFSASNTQASEALRQAIYELNSSSTRLGWITIGLTVVMLAATVAQILIALHR